MSNNKGYNKIFEIFCKISNNPEAPSFPQHAAFAATSFFCFTNFAALFYFIRVFLFEISWRKDDNTYLLVIGLIILVVFYFYFLYKERYKKFWSEEYQKATTKEKIQLGVYIFLSLFFFIGLPLFSGIKNI